MYSNFKQFFEITQRHLSIVTLLVLTLSASVVFAEGGGGGGGVGGNGASGPEPQTWMFMLFGALILGSVTLLKSRAKRRS